MTIGIQAATCSIIGNCIGAHNVMLAKRFFRIITKFTMATILTMSMIIFFAREQIVAVYTTEEAVKATCTRVFAILACIFMFDGM